MQPFLRNSQAGAIIDPMQVDVAPEENDNNEEELYEVDIESFVRIFSQIVILNFF